MAEHGYFRRGYIPEDECMQGTRIMAWKTPCIGVEAPSAGGYTTIDESMLGTKTSTWDTSYNGVQTHSYGWSERSFTFSAEDSQQQSHKPVIVDDEEEIPHHIAPRNNFDRYINKFKNIGQGKGANRNGRNRPSVNTLQQKNIPAARYPVAPALRQPVKTAGNPPMIDHKEAALKYNGWILPK